MKDETLIAGNKPYQERARNTLPILISLAQTGETILYSELAQLIDIENPRSFNYILGYIGEAIQKLEKIHKTKIPKIQCIVLNKSDGLPGAGVGWFLPEKEDFNQLNKEQKRNFVDKQLFEIYKYKKWDWVLDRLGLEPIEIDFDEEIQEIKKGGFGGGESKEHLEFKELVAQNPKSIGLSEEIVSTTIEYKLASADEIDILFEFNKKLIGIEIKSKKSNDKDILRGIFQCIKYKAVLKAEQMLTNQVDSDCFLVIEGDLTEKLRNVALLLKVNVIEYKHYSFD